LGSFGIASAELAIAPRATLGALQIALLFLRWLRLVEISATRRRRRFPRRLGFGAPRQRRPGWALIVALRHASNRRAGNFRCLNRALGRNPQYSCARNFVRNEHHHAHFFHIVHPHDVSAIQNSSRYRRSGRENSLVFGFLPQERFPGRAHQNRQFEPRQLPEMRQNLGILVAPLSKPESGIDHDAVLFHSGAARPAHHRLQIPANRVRSVWKRRQFRPGLRSTPHVVQDQAGVRAGGSLRESRVEREPARVVDDFHAIIHGAGGDFRFIRIDRNRGAQIVAQPLEHRYQPLPFFVR